MITSACSPNCNRNKEINDGRWNNSREKKKSAGALKFTFFSLDIVDILMRIEIGTSCSFMDLFISTIRQTISGGQNMT